MQDQPQNPKPTQRPHSGVSGRVVVAMTLSLFIVVPVITYLAYSLTQGEPQRITLDYAERESWFMMPVKSRPLRYSKFVQAETGKEYKKTDLTLEPGVERVIQRCVSMAQDDGFFDNADARDELLAFASQADNGFYPAYLLASWYQVNNQPDDHTKWMGVAFERAGGAISQRLVDERGQPVADDRLPPVAIGYDRVTKGVRDATLVLIYPAPISEANGFIYLPTFRSVYRFTDASLPLGVDPGLHPTQLTLLPQASVGTEPNWFAVPDGAVGQLDDAVVSTQ